MFRTEIFIEGMPCDKCAKPASEADPIIDLTQIVTGTGARYHNIRIHVSCVNKIIAKAMKKE